MILEGKDIASGIRDQANVCVVGSGAGGAYLAHRLASLGRSVVVLEEGGAYFRHDLTGRVKDAVTTLYRNRGLDLALGVPSIMVPTGRCLGGTTVINMGVCFRAPDAVLAAWKASGLNDFGAEEMIPVYDRVESLMSVRPVEPDVMGRAGEVVAEGAARLGLHPEPIRRAVSNACRGCGNCAYGCTEDAKQSMTVGLIPEASRAGARFYCDARAERILHDGERVTGVRGKVLERTTGRPLMDMEVMADKVVLASGAMGTPALLMASGLSGKGPIGCHLKLHLCVRATGVFDDDIDGFRGACQSVFIGDYRERGIMLESTFTGPCTQIPGFFGFGEKFLDLCKSYRKMATIGVLINEKSEGRVYRSIAGNPVVTFRVSRDDAQTLHRGLIEADRILFAAGARKVINGSYAVPVLSDMSDVESAAEIKAIPKDLLIMAFHPQGTCRMGVNPRTSVVDEAGAFHGLKNLYVADASVFPTSVGVNPQETIWAVSHKIADAVAQAT